MNAHTHSRQTGWLGTLAFVTALSAGAAHAAIDLSLTKTVEPDSVAGQLVFTLTLTNGGPDQATGVVVKDLLPSGYTFVNASATVGTYAAETGWWNVPALAAATPATLTVTALERGEGDHRNVAEVIAASPDDTDSTPGNCLTSPTEDDCAVAVPPQTWPVSAGDTDSDSETLEGSPGKRVAKAPSGAAYLVGHFRNTIRFGVWSLTADENTTDGFLVKYDALGNVEWVREFGPRSTSVGGYRHVRAVALDASENVYIAGEFTGSITIGSSEFTSNGFRDGFVASFGPNGAHRWAKRVYSTADETALAIAVRPDPGSATNPPSVHAGGACREPLTYEGLSGTAPCTTANGAWVAKLRSSDGTGELLGVVSSASAISDLALDASNQKVYALGPTGDDFRVWEVKSDNTLSLVKDVTGTTAVADIAAAGGSVFLAGSTTAGEVFGSNPAEHTGAAVAKLVGTQWQWIATTEGGSATAVDAIGSGDSVAVYAAGYFETSMTVTKRDDTGGQLKITLGAVNADARLVEAPPVTNDYFSDAVDVDGSFALVGDASGHARIFQPNDLGDWSEKASLPVPLGNAIKAVAILGDRAAVATATAAFVYERPAGGWSPPPTAKALTPTACSATWNAVHSVDVAGDVAVVGAAEGAYLFMRGQGAWDCVKRLATTGVTTGIHRVALDQDRAAIIVVPAKAFVFRRDAGGSGQWGLEKELSVSGGEAVAVSVGAVATVVIGNASGNAGKGEAYVFTSASNWGDTGGGLGVNTRTLTASDATADAGFGVSVGADGNYIVVGAPREDALAQDAGAAYVFARDSGGAGLWGQILKIVSSNWGDHEVFGTSVAIRAGWAIVGSPRDTVGTSNGAGAGYLFAVAQDYIPLSPLQAGRFGSSVDVDGDIAVVGAQYDDQRGSHAGAAYVFERQGGTWTRKAKLVSNDADANDRFGFSVGVDDGTSRDTIVVGAPDGNSGGGDCGEVYVFERAAGAQDWTPKTRFERDCTYEDFAENDNGACNSWNPIMDFGYSVDVDGGVIVVGDPNTYHHNVYGLFCGSSDDWRTGKIWIYERSSNGTWEEKHRRPSWSGAMHNNDYQGWSVAVRADGVKPAVVMAGQPGAGGNERGRVAVYKTPWGDPVLLSALEEGGGDHLGRSIALRGDTALFGAPQDDSSGGTGSSYWDFGSAYLFKEQGGGNWTEVVKLMPADLTSYDQFGRSVALNGSLAVVGAHNDSGQGDVSDAVYLFDRDMDWGEAAKLRSPGWAPPATDGFGGAVGTNGTDVFVGAYLASSDSGAAYVFEGLQDRDVFAAALRGSTGAWRWAAAAQGPGRDVAESVSAAGSVVQLAGTFEQTLSFGGTKTLHSNGDRDVYLGVAGDNGNWFDFVTATVGAAITPPNDALGLESLRTNNRYPFVFVNGVEDPYSNPVYHIWDNKSGLYFSQPVGSYRILWPTNAENPCDPATKVNCYEKFGIALWPRKPCAAGESALCYQLHIAGAPVQALPTARYTSPQVKLPKTESSGAFIDTATNVFTATSSGWSVLRYTDSGSSPAEAVKLVVVRTLDPYDDSTGDQNDLDVGLLRASGAFREGEACTIGTKLNGATFGHNEPGHEGHVLFEKAFYDAAAYARATRTGPILPVNRWKSARSTSTPPLVQDAKKRMAVAWYRNNGTGVYWPSIAVEYDCQWPSTPEKIAITSQRGHEVNNQAKLEPSIYPLAQLYVQDNVSLAGYNPNDEHALLAPSNTDPPNTCGDPPVVCSAVFALRNGFGGTVDGNKAASDPYVLLKYQDPASSNEWKMRVFQVVTSLGSPPASDCDPVVTTTGQVKVSTTGTAGDKIDPPYPLSLFAPCLSTAIEGEIAGEPLPPVPFYRDRTGALWGRAAACGKVLYHYPLEGDFFVDDDNNDVKDKLPGTCVEWKASDGATQKPVASVLDVAWPTVPAPRTLAVGGRLLDTKDRPAVQVVFDELQERTLRGRVCSVSMVSCTSDEVCPTGESCDPAAPTPPPPPKYDPEKTLARLLDPLTPRAVPLDWNWSQFRGEGFVLEQGGEGRWEIVAGRCGRLSPSLRRRLYFEPTNQELVVRGVLDESGSGDPLLLLNMLTEADRQLLRSLDEDPCPVNAPAPGANCATASCPTAAGHPCTWDQAVDALFCLSRNPEGMKLHDPDAQAAGVPKCTVNVSGLGNPKVTCTGGDPARTWIPDGPLFGSQDAKRCNKTGSRVCNFNSDCPSGETCAASDGIVEPLKVVDGGAILSAGYAQGRGYVTVAYNDEEGVADAVDLEVINVGCTGSDAPPNDVYPGTIHVLAPDNLFDEQVTLRLGSDFAGQAERSEFSFEWYRHADESGVSPALPPCSQVDCSSPVQGWEKLPGLGGAVVPRDQITIGGDDARSLSDNWYLARFKGLPVCPNSSTWTLFAGDPGGTTAQLSRGWVKRVVDRLNPFKQRVDDFHEPDSQVGTVADMLSQLGERYEHDIPLTGEVDNDAGLIEAYETVLRRAMDLSVNQETNDPGANAALLNIATRLADFYMLLGNEAYADAQDPTIGIRTDDDVPGLGSLAPTIFAFENQLASPLEEELVLLRGRDDSQAAVNVPPAYNRLYWNFTSGLGEVAYAQSYAISDRNADGQVNAEDARKQFPQGHGDAWGHYLSALNYHYRLLRHQYFTWVPRPEAVPVSGVPVQVDFLDERKFAQIAAARARAGAEIVDLTYRNEYVEDVEGQWQGYKDTNVQRAWGVDEWARRAGTGAYLDWVMGNAMLPAIAPGTCAAPPATSCTTDADCGESGRCNLPTGIRRIDRQTVPELGEIVAQYDSIQAQLDEADKGLNPLGLAKGVVPFDIAPTLVDAGQTHFEQVYDRAVSALDNAVDVWDYANTLTRMLRANQDSAEDLARNVDERERDFKARLTEILGTPYPDDIGAGKSYPAGYGGFDWKNWRYIDLAQLGTERLDQVNLCGDSSSCVGGSNTGGACWVDSRECPGGGTCNSSSNRCAGGDKDGRACAPDASECPGGTCTAIDSPNCNNGVLQVRTLNGYYKPFKTGSFFIGDRNDEVNFIEHGGGDWRDCYFDPDFYSACADQNDVQTISYTVTTLPDLGDVFVKPQEWTSGPRRVTGTIQTAQQDVELAKLSLKRSIVEYDNLVSEIESAGEDLQDFLGFADTQIDILVEEREWINAYEIVIQGANATSEACMAAYDVATLQTQDKGGWDALKNVMFASFGSAARVVGAAAKVVSGILQGMQEDISRQAGIALQIQESQLEASRLLRDIEALLREEPLLRAEMLTRAQALQQARERLGNTAAEAARLLDEFERFKIASAGPVQEHRYRDMAYRVFRNDALQKYRAAFDMGARYTYLAATAYDYDTNLLRSDAQAGNDFLTGIVRERSLGQILDDEPVPGSRGLADPLGRMEQNFFVLKGQMGFNNPQIEGNAFSLRGEHFRLPKAPAAGSACAATDAACQFREELRGLVVPHLWNLAEFRRFALPFAPEPSGCPDSCTVGKLGTAECAACEPGLVIPFDTTVTFGLNYFGEELGAGDSAYDPSNFATRIRAAGVWFTNYSGLNLAATPRVYLIPVGMDVLRTPGDPDFGTRQWQVVDQLLPIPFPIGAADLQEPGWMPLADSLSDAFGQTRRFASFRAYPTTDLAGAPDPGQFNPDSRLIGRSVWNTRWLLIIPGGTLLNDPVQGLNRFICGQAASCNGAPSGATGVHDIKIYFKTYAYSGW